MALESFCETRTYFYECQRYNGSESRAYETMR
jgi:hypothetical protein